MQIPRSKAPNTYFSGSSTDHFLQAIVILIDLIEQVSTSWTSFNVVEQTRAGIAAYDAVISTIKGKSKLRINFNQAMLQKLLMSPQNTEISQPMF